MDRQPKCRYCDFTIVLDGLSEEAKNHEFRSLIWHCYSVHPEKMSKSPRLAKTLPINRKLNREVIIDDRGFDQFDKPVPLDRLFRR